jgi:hypothetical protein
VADKRTIGQPDDAERRSSSVAMWPRNFRLLDDRLGQDADHHRERLVVED